MFITCGLLNRGCIQVLRMRTRNLTLSLTADKSWIYPETNEDILLCDIEQIREYL